MNGASQKAILVALGVVATMGVLGAVMTRENQPQAAQILGFCSLICVSLLGLLQQIRATYKTEEVKDVLAAATAKTSSSTEKLTNVAIATHALVNSNMAVQLKISAAALRRIADITKEPSDVSAALAAEALLEEHIEKQKIVDEKEEVENKVSHD